MQAVNAEVDGPGDARFRDTQDDGFTLIEVVVALALFAVLSTAVLAVVQDSQRLTRQNESRVSAASLATRVLEMASIADPTQPLPASGEIVSGGVAYRVTRGAEFVQQEGSSVRCGVAPDRRVAQRLHVEVDWPARPQGVPPVRLASLRTVDLQQVAPSTGTLYVVVESSDGSGVGDVTVTLAPTTATVTTDPSGCAVFAGVEARDDYQVTIARTGYADPAGVTSPTRGPLRVLRGGVNHTIFVYEPAAQENPPSGLSAATSCDQKQPSASLSWTATTWPLADGYYLRRTVGGVLERDWSLEGVGTTSSTDGPLTNGTTYTYQLAARSGSTTSDFVTANFTPSC